MAYEMTSTTVTLDDLEGHSQVAGLSAAFYTIPTDSVLAVPLHIVELLV